MPVLVVIMLRIMSVGMGIKVVTGIAPILQLGRSGTGATAMFRRAGCSIMPGLPRLRGMPFTLRQMDMPRMGGAGTDDEGIRIDPGCDRQGHGRKQRE
jgi:hypothetical protein